MLSITAGKRASEGKTREATHRTPGLMSRKVWLPKFLYNALPYFYMAAGFLAFLSTLYTHQWFWLLPHYLLFSIACVHLGFIVRRRRHGTGKT